MKVDMSAHAVTTRLRRISQLRRLALSLRKAKLPAKPDHLETDEESGKNSVKPNKLKSK